MAELNASVPVSTPRRLDDDSKEGTIERIGVALLAVSLLVLPLLDGSRRGWPLHLAPVLLVGIGVLAVASASGRLPRGPSALLVLPSVLAGMIQLIPWPAGWVQAVSPVVYEAYARAYAVDPMATVSFLPVTVNRAATFHGLALALGYASLFMAGSVWLHRPRALRRVLAAVAVGGLIEIVALLVVDDWLPLLGQSADYQRPEGYTGTYVNKNSFSGYLEMAAFCALGLALDAWRRHRPAGGAEAGVWGRLRIRLLDALSEPRSAWSILWSLVVFLLAVGVLLGRSRAGITIFLGLAIVWALGAQIRWSKVGVLRGVGLVVGILAVLFPLLAVGVQKVMDYFEHIELSFDGRVEIYRCGMSAIRQSPVLGTGLETWGDAFSHYATPYFGSKHSPHAHCDYLELAVNAGLPAALALVVGVIWVTLRARGCLVATPKSSSPTDSGRGLRTGAWLACAALALHGLTDFNFQHPANYSVFLVLLAGLAASGSSAPRLPLHRGHTLATVALAIAVMGFVAVVELPLGLREGGRWDLNRMRMRDEVSTDVLGHALAQLGDDRSVFFTDGEETFEWVQGARRFLSERAADQVEERLAAFFGMSPEQASETRRSNAVVYKSLVYYAKQAQLRLLLAGDLPGGALSASERERTFVSVALERLDRAQRARPLWASYGELALRLRIERLSPEDLAQGGTLADFLTWCRPWGPDLNYAIAVFRLYAGDEERFFEGVRRAVSADSNILPRFLDEADPLRLSPGRILRAVPDTLEAREAVADYFIRKEWWTEARTEADRIAELIASGRAGQADKIDARYDESEARRRSTVRRWLLAERMGDWPVYRRLLAEQRVDERNQAEQEALRAEARMADGYFLQAEDAARNALRAYDSRCARAWFVLAECARRELVYDTALDRMIELLLNTDPERTLLEQIAEQAVRLADDPALSGIPAQRAALVAAVAHARLGAPDLADSFRRRVADPIQVWADAHAIDYFLGEHYFAKNAWGEAERAYRSVLAVVPDHPAALERLAAILERSGRLDEAEDVQKRLAAWGEEADRVDRDFGNLIRLRAIERSTNYLEWDTPWRLGLVWIGLGRGVIDRDHAERSGRPECQTVLEIYGQDKRILQPQRLLFPVERRMRSLRWGEVVRQEFVMIPSGNRIEPLDFDPRHPPERMPCMVQIVFWPISGSFADVDIPYVPPGTNAVRMASDIRASVEKE